VQGTGQVKYDSAINMVEGIGAGQINYNFNPPGAPYPWPNGTTNATISTSDSYPSQISGLIYFSGDILIKGTSSIGMVMTGGNANVNSCTITPNYDSTFSQNPPPGFYDVPMTAASASWMQ